MLETMGIYDDLNNYINQASNSVKIAYNNATYWDRNSTLIGEFGELMGFDQNQLDEFFYNASKINVD